MIPYLEGFIKRMEVTACISSIINRKNTSKKFEGVGGLFSKYELDNIIFSVLVHIMERTLTEENDCTINDIGHFISEILPCYKKYLTNNELLELSRYIIKDILQNKGEAFSYYVMDYSDGKLKEQNVRLISDKVNNNNELVYFLTPQGYNMLLRTKEIDDFLGFQIEEIKMKLLIEKGYYSSALRQSFELLHMLNEKQYEIELFEQKLNRDASSVSGEEFNNIYNSIDSMLNEEYNTMEEIKKIIKLAKDNFDEEMKLGKNSDELIKAWHDVNTISENIENILEKQRRLLINLSKLRNTFSNAIKSAINIRKMHCYNIEDVILKNLENYENNNINDIEKICAMLLSPLVLPKFPDILNIGLFYSPQLFREISENVTDTDEEILDNTYQKIAIEKRNNANVKIIELLFEYASLHKEFRFSDFWKDCIANRDISYFTQEKLIFIVMLNLFEIGCINIEKWKNDDNIPRECDGEFNLSYALGKIYNEKKHLFNIKKLYIKKDNKKISLEWTENENEEMIYKYSVDTDELIFYAEVNNDNA